MPKCSMIAALLHDRLKTKKKIDNGWKEFITVHAEAKIIKIKKCSFCNNAIVFHLWSVPMSK